jgi:hypothetical protein
MDQLVPTDAKGDWSASCAWIRVLKYDWNKGKQDRWRLAEELDKDVVYHKFYSAYTTNTLPTKLLEGGGGLDTSE